MSRYKYKNHGFFHFIFLVFLCLILFVNISLTVKAPAVNDGDEEDFKPYVTLDYEYSGCEKNVTFIVTLHKVPDSDLSKWVGTIVFGDETSEEFRFNENPEEIEHEYSKINTYEVEVRVINSNDIDTLPKHDKITITLEHCNPDLSKEDNIELTLDKNYPGCGNEITITASVEGGSTDNFNYDFIFGDGTEEEITDGRYTEINHEYPGEGTYTCTAKSYDNNGNEDTSRISISINNCELTPDDEQTEENETSGDSYTQSDLNNDSSTDFEQGSDNETDNQPDTNSEEDENTNDPDNTSFDSSNSDNSPNETFVNEEINIGNITSNENKTVQTEKHGSTCIYEVNFKLKEDKEDLKLSISNLEEKPKEIKEEASTDDISKDPEYEGLVYNYLDIKLKENGAYLAESEFEKMSFKFKVSKKWIIDNVVNLDTVKMVRYHNGTWQTLETKLIEWQKEKYFYFEAESPGLSTFAVVGGKVVEKGENSSGLEEEKIPWSMIVIFIFISIVILIFVLVKSKFIYTK